MARKRVVEAPSLHSWEDVNDALRQIAEAQIALGEIQSDMQKQILGAQKVAEEQSKPLNDNVAKLEREIKSFVTDHRDEMGKTKSMVLTFGEVGFRLSTSVSLPRAKEKLEEIIRRLKSRQMTDCIVVEEKVSKEALKKYGVERGAVRLETPGGDNLVRLHPNQRAVYDARMGDMEVAEINAPLYVTRRYNLVTMKGATITDWQEPRRRGKQPAGSRLVMVSSC